MLLLKCAPRRKGCVCLAAVMTVFLLFVWWVPLPVQALSDEEVKAPSAVLMDPVTRKVLYEKNPDEKRPIASVTKVMTLLLVMEAIDDGKISLSDVVSTSEHAASMGGSDIWLKPGETMTVDDLLKATVIMSANDAAVALAEHVAGSEDEFVSRMNQRAKELGMTNTVFKNCNGLDEDGHLSTARDVALMSSELIKHEKIFDYSLTWMDYLRDGKTQLVNTNKLIRSYKGITGLKTGTTSQAGSCIAATAKRNDLSLVSVVLGCSSTADRFASASTLLDYGFANWTTTVPQIPALEPVPVTNGMLSFVELEASMPSSLIVPKGMEKQIKTTLDLPETLQAPIEQGQLIGSVQFSLENGEALTSCKLYAKHRVAPITFGSLFQILFHALVNL